jgi:hypothetical protein
VPGAVTGTAVPGAVTKTSGDAPVTDLLGEGLVVVLIAFLGIALLWLLARRRRRGTLPE